MERYDSYKDSGVDWIGQIPEHWETFRIKNVAKLFSGNGFPINIQGNRVGDYPVYKAGDLNKPSVYIDQSSNYISNNILAQYKFTKIPSNSILFPKIGEAMKKNGRKINLSSCCIDNNCSAFNVINDNVNILFFYYYLKIVDMAYFDNGGAIPCLNTSRLLSAISIVPPLSEQQAIVAYLDEETGKLDAAVEKLERMVDVLKERKQLIISKAVTRGLDDTVPLKDSGVDWIGQIPEHWQKFRFKNLLQIKSKKSDSFFKVGLENIESQTGRFLSSSTLFDGDGIAFESGDILYGKLRPYLQKAWLANCSGSAVGDFFVYKVQPICVDRFMLYVLLSKHFTEVCTGATYGAKMPRVASEFISALPYFLPPIAEQQAIAAYLDEKVGKLDEVIEKQLRMIELLKERKQILISDVVTGKIKVA